jgi:hypothetical protein
LPPGVIVIETVLVEPADDPASYLPQNLEAALQRMWSHVLGVDLPVRTTATIDQEGAGARARGAPTPAPTLAIQICPRWRGPRL